MAIIYANQISEMAIEATYGGKPHVTVLHFFNDESAMNDAAKARDILDNWQDHVLGILVNTYQLQGATWRSLDRNDLNQGTLAPDAAKPLAGASAVNGSPPNVTYLIRKITNDRQRGQRDGRMFLSGVPESVANADGTVDAATRNSFQTNMQAFFDGVTDNAFGVGGASGLAVLNTTPLSRDKGTHEVDLTWRSVRELVIDSQLATQRDRLR